MNLARYDRSHLAGVVALCEAEGWPSFPADPERAQRIDLVTDTAKAFYSSFDHHTLTGFRIYP